ncbi:MAG: hypothetical protein OEW85_11950, partial [Acidimicrobiia bacterium]|nr:hypothetical protein [Acidimicrobiia bacterium]
MALLSHRGRKRRIRTALVVVAVIVAAEVGAQILAPRLEPVPHDWPNAMTQLQHHQLELLQGTQLDGTNIPVVFVGDSGAQQAFIPDEFAAIDEGNRLSYNASIPGGVPRVTRDWLLSEVIPQLEPDVVVWGIGISDVTEGYGKVQVEAYSGSLGAKDGAFAGLERAAADASALVRLRPVLRDPSLLMGDGRDAVVDDMAAAERLLAPAGQRLGYQPGTDDEDATAVAATLGSFAIDERDVSAITDTITKIRRRGKQVVLVELPTSPQVIESLPNGAEDLSTFRQALADVATETNAQVLRAIGPFTEDDFVDPIHLTEEAAESVTGQVAAALPSLELDDAAATFSQGAGLARTVEQADNQAVRTRLSALSDALDAMDQACNEPARWMDEALGVIDALDRAAFEIGEGVTDDDTRFRASALARQISSS